LKGVVKATITKRLGPQQTGVSSATGGIPTGLVQNHTTPWLKKNCCRRRIDIIILRFLGVAANEVV